ncbi:MAG: DUF2332 domain-containing protein [Intrasporangium sp.]|uniref:DUF2332 domain-containing protein n=1 Tax=Intrasporangium sp. TaxID=1925024 RepID=UPI002648C410|nr:DUF2332 domain-containing protein [Intrasporangium sp.]MDN5794581.1 DUF2332 domain-containing protein [Intrasporangium sp.]
MRSRSSWSAEDLAEVRRSFARFAEEYANLPLYRAICLGMADDPEPAALLLHAQPGQARPVLFLAALHDLVLRRPDLPAARWYPSVVGPDAVPGGDPWPDVLATIQAHREELRETIATRRTQTNEVNRAVYVATVLALASADVPARPTILVELGASAGLLLAVDRYRIELHRRGVALVVGDPASPVRCRGEDRSPTPLPDLVLPPIRGRAGLDLAPVDLDDEASVRWLEACLWPDVPGRVERFRAAITLLRENRPALHAGDMAGDLDGTIDITLAQAGQAGRSGIHLIVFSSWALTYVERRRRTDIAEVLADVAQTLGAVSWVTAEPVGCAPGIPVPNRMADGMDSTVLGGRRWRHGLEMPAEAWGTCHPHGEWIALSESALGGIR